MVAIFFKKDGQNLTLMTLDRNHCQLVPKWLMTPPLEHCHTDCVFMVAIFLNKWTIGTGIAHRSPGKYDVLACD